MRLPRHRSLFSWLGSRRLQRKIASQDKQHLVGAPLASTGQLDITWHDACCKQLSRQNVVQYLISLLPYLTILYIENNEKITYRGPHQRSLAAICDTKGWTASVQVATNKSSNYEDFPGQRCIEQRFRDSKARGHKVTSLSTSFWHVLTHVTEVPRLRLAARFFFRPSGEVPREKRTKVSFDSRWNRWLLRSRVFQYFHVFPTNFWTEACKGSAVWLQRLKDFHKVGRYKGVVYAIGKASPNHRAERQESRRQKLRYRYCETTQNVNAAYHSGTIKSFLLIFTLALQRNNSTSWDGGSYLLANEAGRTSARKASTMYTALASQITNGQNVENRWLDHQRNSVWTQVPH